jgi:hypothetical protein
MKGRGGGERERERERDEKTKVVEERRIKEMLRTPGRTHKA